MCGLFNGSDITKLDLLLKRLVFDIFIMYFSRQALSVGLIFIVVAPISLNRQTPGAVMSCHRI